MAIFSKDIDSMEDLYLHTLRDIYYAEKQIEKALPKMIDKASDQKLKDAFSHHLDETHGHVRRLEELFDMIGAKAKGVDCPAIDGIIKETEDITSDISDKAVCDAALAAAAQAVEHYEITRYGTLIAWSNELGRPECADLLKQTIAEEEAADNKLTEVAESRLNEIA
ncbi:Ferritin-like metal-binding protein YciE [Lutimaribacter pacificus]|uniref:Ferritin-like metal-binding protein YciE n=1 Tax=Lutimaribacter pacificus TaxID=391948 RepID=A0A1H0LVM3_9RHOB|nr:ferritin-like domain-containing protein [Lutimaribacter pacificus]SDO72174.1 Ferritin-like metal-binding protein YciE [Lutimaribacter pacificus]SHK02736.1 Ferritin-like metal-binding protein YciE [Lutimaribacter pacificus]